MITFIILFIWTMFSLLNCYTVGKVSDNREDFFDVAIYAAVFGPIFSLLSFLIFLGKYFYRLGKKHNKEN